MAIKNYRGCLKIASFDKPYRTLQGLSKMVLAKVIAFAVLKALHNLVSMQK